MLAIRMQRTGRKGHAMFRVVVQDARRTPTSGKVVAQIGSYDPHGKVAILKKDKASFYLDHGAQPSERVIKLLVSEGVALPAWVKQPSTDKQRAIRNSDKLRHKQPEEAAPAVEESGAEQAEAEQQAEAAPADAPKTPAEQPVEAGTEADTPAETPSSEKTEA